MSTIKKKLVAVISAAIVGGAMFAGPAQAVTLLGQDPDAELLVNRGGLEWAYAAPCAGESPSCGVVQLHHGFRFATAAEWLANFISTQDVYDAFKRPNGSFRCAATYFSTVHDHCDPSNILGFTWHAFGLAGNFDPNNGAGETFLVRAGQNVPEPASAALVALGLFGVASLRRRKTS